MVDNAMIDEVLDAFSDNRVTCGHPNLFREGLAAMQTALIEAAGDLLEAAALIATDEAPAAVGILRRVADEAHRCARTVEIAVRTQKALHTKRSD